MRTWYVLFILIFTLGTTLVGQTIFSESFDNGVPPANWTIDGFPTSWLSSNSAFAGGSAPEVRFAGSVNSFVGTSRLISPTMDMTGISGMIVEFKYQVDHNFPPYKIGVATRSGNGPWNIVWDASPTASGSDYVVFPVVNSDMGSSNFQICWYFSGDTENIIDWYFDDIVIRHMDAHDILVESMRVDDHYEPGEVVRPRAKLVNMGANRDTVDVSLSISVGGTEVFSEVQTINGLGSGYSSFATFSNFTAAEPNELYTYRVISHLATDTNPANDTLVGNFDTYTNERQLVLMEIGTGTWCQFCPGSAMGADDMIHNGHNVAIIEYHKAVNGGPDPFDNLYSTFRVNYYSISGFPTTVFDGVERIVGGSTNTSLYPSYLARYNQRIPIKTPFTIDIGGSGSGSNYNVDVRINKMAPVRDTQDNLALHMVLTESHIRYTWRGIDSLHFVAREMYPDFNGMSIDLRAVDSLRISRSLNLNSSWVGNNCELVVFIQDRNTKEVLQTNKVALRNLQPLTGVEEPIATLPATARLLGNYPNPFNPGTTIAYELAHNADMEISIYNLLGQKVRTLVKGNMPAGPGQVTWNGTDQNGLPVASGIYLYRLESENRVFTRKMVLLK